MGVSSVNYSDSDRLADSIAKLSQGRENWYVGREGVPVDDSSGEILYLQGRENWYIGREGVLTSSE